jgi:carbon monoxide dehydrogenase subunit G
LRLALAAAIALLVATGASAGPVEVSLSRRVHAPPDRVLDLLGDFEAWDRTFRSVQLVRTERHSANHARLRQVTRQAGRTLVYSIIATLHRDEGRLDIALDPSEPNDLLLLSTTWRVAPHPAGGSQVELRVAMESGVPIPAIVERLAVERSARRTLDDLARAVEQRLAANAVPPHG